MKHYHKESLYILRRLSNIEYEIIDDLSRDELEPYLYLHREGVIFYGCLNVGSGRHLCVKINPKGLTYLATLEDAEIKFTKPYRILVAALFLSVVAILISLSNML